MVDQETIDQLNAGYRCPPNAGPAWREAAAAGIDMRLLESSLQMAPWKRLRENQRALKLTQALAQAGRQLRERPPDHP